MVPELQRSETIEFKRWGYQNTAKAIIQKWTL